MIPFNIAAIRNPRAKPGIANEIAYTIIVIPKFFVLKPRALSIPNSYVFSSTSESMSE